MSTIRLALMAKLVVIGNDVFSHCHDNEPDEDGLRWLIGWRKWDTDSVTYNIVALTAAIKSGLSQIIFLRKTGGYLRNFTAERTI